MLVTISHKNKEEEFQLIREGIRNCLKCPMVDHSLIFPGKYIEDMKYFFVGAATFNKAGEEEAFRYGKASKNFDDFLYMSGIDRKNCFTTNAVMHVPIHQDGTSRPQTDEELMNCKDWLYRQISFMKPNLIVALGSVALRALDLIKYHSLTVTKHSGTGHLWFGDKYIFVLCHPSPNSFMVRSKEKQIEDYKKLKEFQGKLNSKN